MKQPFTKHFAFAACFFICFESTALFAQSEVNTNPTKEANYLVKVNLLSLPLNNYSFQLERSVGKKMAVGLGLRFMPESGIPFASTVEGLINDPESWDQIKKLKTSNFAITPEVRFYFGRGVFHGFYLAPFVRYTHYTVDLPFNFDVPDQAGNTTTEQIPLTGQLNTLTGGLLAGAQWAVSSKIYIDWSILGPQYGFSNGTLTGKRALNNDEQDAVRQELGNLEDLPLIKTTYTVDNSGVVADLKGPWAGVRSSLGIGIRF
mgnify:CR=1 FL=1